MIVQGILLEKGLVGFHLFDFAYIGIPLSLAGILYMVFIGHYLLRSRNHNIEMFEDEQDYIYQFIVDKNSSLLAKPYWKRCSRFKSIVSYKNNEEWNDNCSCTK